MLDILSYEKLASEVGIKFLVTNLPQPLELELVEITERRATHIQEYFSLIFRGARKPVLPQQIYRLENEKFGAGELFLVPVGENQQGVEYEAAFNRLLADKRES